MHDFRRFSLGVAIVLFAIATPPASARAQARAAGSSTRTDETARPAAEGVRPAGSIQYGAANDPTKNPFWEVLNDTTLNRLMAEALRGNLQLQAATARVDGADAVRLQAALELVPTVSASAGYNRRRLASATFPGAGPGTLPDQGLWESGLNAAWELDVFGRLRGGLRAQNALVGAAGENLRAAQVTLAAELARSYLQLRGLQSQLVVAQRNAQNQRRTLELTERRLAAGRGTEFDTERARAQLSFTQAAIPELESRIAGMQHRIAVLAGRPPRELAAELAEPARLPALPDSVPIMSTADVLHTRPDVRSAQSRVVASRALVGSARADYLPRLTLTAGAGYTASAVDRFGNDGTFNYTFGPVISWPAFDLGRVKARVDEAQAQELEARAHYQQVVLQAQEQLESAAVQYRTARTRLEHLRAAAAASERAAGLATVRYQGGIADLLQVLDAERTLLAAQDQLARAETQAADAYVRLFEVRGASWPVSR
jgi:NodT family efflux transporter outer membrane factor (OMF) lipoprotein